MFETALKQAAARVSAHLETVLAGHRALPLTQAMGYALAGGKGLRGLVAEGGTLADLKGVLGDADWTL